MSAVTILVNGRLHRGLHNVKAGLVSYYDAGKVLYVGACDIVPEWVSVVDTQEQGSGRAVFNCPLTKGVDGRLTNGTVPTHTKDASTGQVQTRAQRAELLPSILKKQAF